MKLSGGRIAVAYAERANRRMVARISTNGGGLWGDKIILRDMAVRWDIGYPRSVVLDSGKILTAYYWLD